MTRTVRVLAWTATGLTGAGTLLALLGRQHWVADLFSHFPVHYLAGAGLAAGVFLVLGHSRAAVLALSIAGANLAVAWPYVPGLLLPVRNEAATRSVSLVAWNLNYRNVDFHAARRYLADRDPDIILVSEFTPRGLQALASLEASYPHMLLRPRLNAWGMALYSRYPILDAQDLALVNPESSNIRAVLDLPGGAITLYGVHLASPTSKAATQLRNLQLQALGRIIDAAGADDRNVSAPTVVVGDFNVTPFAPSFRDFVRATGLRDARRPWGLHFTWPTSWLPVWVAIDHCLVNGAVDVSRTATGSGSGSDHRPLEVVFSTRAESTGP